MRQVLQFAAAAVTAAVVAACSAAPLPLGSMPRSLGAADSHRAAAPAAFTAMPAQMAFAGVKAPAQTLAVSGPDMGDVQFSVAPAGVVTVARVNGKDADGSGSDDSGDGKARQFVVTPVGLGSATITVRHGNDSAVVSVPVIVGPALNVAVAPSSTIDCTVLPCSSNGIQLINATSFTQMLPFTLTISEPGYAGAFTVTNTDGNCGVPGGLPSPFAATSTASQVTIGMAQAAFAGKGAFTVNCSVTVSDAQGNAQTVALSWIV